MEYRDGQESLGNEEGFTLVELLIVVAVIGVLAAIAIPNFSAYRVRAFNAGSVGDLNVLKTDLESYYADHRRYP